MELKGGYMVQPVPAPLPTNIEPTINSNDGISNQKLMLLSLGNAISGAPIINGTNQFPKPPIRAGMTTKKIINSP